MEIKLQTQHTNNYSGGMVKKIKKLEKQLVVSQQCI